MNHNWIREKKRTQIELQQRHFELSQMWPNNTNVTYIHPERLDHDTVCECCDQPATRIAIANVWGCVTEVYCCAKHYEVNNTWRDSIPYREEAEAER